MHYEARGYDWHGHSVPSMEDHLVSHGIAMLIYTAADYKAMG